MTDITFDVVRGAKWPALRIWYILLGLAAAAVLIVVIHSSQHQRVQVFVTSPMYGEIESSVSAVGTVVPVNDFPARANFTGQVQKIYVRLGQKVHAGQLLLEMKDQYAYSRVASAQAALDSAEVSNENVQHSGSQEDRITFASDLARATTEQAAAANALSTLQKLHARGSASDAEVAAGVQRLQTANASLQALQQRAKARYSPADVASWQAKVTADKATVNAEKVSYANAHITSPISGTAYIIPVTQYDFVPAGSELMHVADLTKLRIHADFYELDVGKLRIGQPVRITWEGNPNHAWEGHVVARPYAVTGAGGQRMGQSTIEFNDQNGDLPVNTTVSVVVTVEKRNHAFTIPREALDSDGPTHFAYRVVNGHLLKTVVNLGIVDAGRAEVIGGLKEGDVVVLHAAGGEKLRDNMKVAEVRD